MPMEIYGELSSSRLFAGQNGTKQLPQGKSDLNNWDCQIHDKKNKSIVYYIFVVKSCIF